MAQIDTGREATSSYEKWWNHSWVVSYISISLDAMLVYYVVVQLSYPISNVIDRMSSDINTFYPHNQHVQTTDAHYLCWNIVEIVEILSKLLKYCQNCWNIVKIVEILSKLLKYCQHCWNIVKIVEILSKLLKYCQNC